MLTKILKAMAPISSCSNDAQLDTELFRPGLGTAIADFYRDPVVTLHLPTYVYDGTVWLSSLVGASSTSASAEATGEGGGGVEAGRADSPLATPHFGARMRTRDRTRHTDEKLLDGVLWLSAISETSNWRRRRCATLLHREGQREKKCF